MMLTAMFTALMLQALPAPGGVRWEMVIGEGEQGLEVDPGTIEREGEVVRYTIRLHVTQANAAGIRVMVLRHVLNCRTRQHGIAAGDGYGADGRLITTRQSTAAEIVYEPFPTGPDADRMHRRLCGAAAS